MKQLLCAHYCQQQCCHDKLCNQYKCTAKVTKQLVCGHQANLPCHLDPKIYACQVSILKVLKCGHVEKPTVFSRFK